VRQNAGEEKWNYCDWKWTFYCDAFKHVKGGSGYAQRCTDHLQSHSSWEAGNDVLGHAGQGDPTYLQKVLPGCKNLGTLSAMLHAFVSL
jgi:hypothetical protein